jgi:outer membrane autotransporter protein
MGTAHADTFINGSFESGTLNGWTIGGGDWYSGAYPVPQDYLPGGSAYNLSSSAVTITSAAFDSRTDNVLSQVYAGSHSVQVNDPLNNNSVSVISQRVNGYTDPLIAFAYAAVLESSHDAEDSDAFIVTLSDATTSETLYSFNLNSATAPGVFTQSSLGWFYTDWQTVSVDVSLRSGHDFVLSLLANDCPYGGHAGYAYLDGFGATEGGGGTGGEGGGSFQYWDGDAAGNANNGLVDGGNGIWSVTATNWTDSSGATNGTQQPSVIFSSAPGTVTIDNTAGAVSVAGMQFAVDGYTIDGEALTLTGPEVVIQVGDGTAAGVDYAAVISADLTGASALTKTDLGTLVLWGVNTYDGPTNVTAGTLVGTATSFGSGDMINDATLVFDQATSATFANVIDGTGSMIKTGAGTLQLTGTSLFIGTTEVAEGKLQVDGWLASSDVTVDSGATLGGHGIVGNVWALAGSTIAPGGSIGTLSVFGDYVQDATSTLQIELTSTGSTDLVDATGAATLASGAKLNVTKTDAPRYVLGTRYTVLAAPGGVTGTFTLSGQTQVSAFINVVDNYDATHAYLDVLQTRSFAAAAFTPNQFAAGTAADTGTGVLYNALVYLPTDGEAQAAFDAISGEIYATTTSWSYEDSRFVREAVIGALNAKPTGRALWGRAFGSWGHMDNDGNASSAKRDIGGFFIGADLLKNDKFQIGIAGGYDYSKLKVEGRSSTAAANDYHVALYGGYRSGGLGVQLGGAYMWRNLGVDRSVAFAGFSDTLSSDYNSHVGQIFGDIGYRFDVAQVQIEPFAELAFINIGTDDVLESGGAAALRIQQQDANITSTLLGARVRTETSFGSVFTTAAWRHAGGDTDTLATMQLVGGGAPFIIGGLPIADNALAVDAGVGFRLGTNGTLDVAYNGQMGGGLSDQGVRATLRYWF